MNLVDKRTIIALSRVLDKISEKYGKHVKITMWEDESGKIHIHDKELDDFDGLGELITLLEQPLIRKIELACLKDNHIWDTVYVDIPFTTSENEIAEVAICVANGLYGEARWVVLDTKPSQCR